MKKIYFVGNAHLDPVWMWRWTEGSCEAKATVRSALDRMKEYPDFKFVCAGASVYKWIEDFAPEMFDEIKERVREGRWRIVGGQHVQPDCNIPSGEGFARQSLYSQRYFKEKFGVTAEIGYNVDSFGHNLMIPQIMKKSGMNGYVFMRPGPHEKEMPASVFKWRSPDGSEIPAYRIHECYCFRFDTAERLDELVFGLEESLPDGAECGMLFYGVGNHGGGPTKRHIELISERAKKHPECEHIFSDVSDYFSDPQSFAHGLPVHTDDLQHHASGCYSAVSEIKSLIRESENKLLMAEGANMLAATLTGKRYLTGEIGDAWQNVLFNHFHDIAGGCSMESAYTDSRHMLCESISFAERAQNSAYQTVSWAIDTSGREKGQPIVIFNPLPFETERVVSVNSEAARVYAPNGRIVPIQHVQSESHATFPRSDTAFVARIPALGYATYYLKGDNEPHYYYMNSRIADEFDTGVRAGECFLENELLRVEIDKKTGYIRSILDKKEGRELLRGEGGVPVVIDETGHDTWSHAKNFFTNEIGRFSSAEIKLLEQGPVRASVQVKHTYGRSSITQIFSLRAGGKTLDVRVILDWQEEHKMLKIAYGVAADAPRAYYEIPFGVIERPADGEEEPGYRWFALKDGRHGYAILNSNKYSFSARDNVMYLTAVRSPLFADHGQPANDRCRFTDQGVQGFSYSFMKLGTDGWENVIKEARMLNSEPTVVLENNHEGYLSSCFEGVSCSRGNVQISAIKRSEDGRGLVVRVYETDGKDTDFELSGGIIRAALSEKIGAYAANTYYLEDGKDSWREVLLTEFDF